ncbi:Msr family ABC-F type ribosomal protection protein [Bacillus sp. Marseille-Q3570]|uniref:Msr family ABC-F type ribosomal protection protein n=1 Tax=Bacillus sp. Marseille-Q3570 TaxID=2963522 RepID=UPI0021B73EC5|nr:ABC-F type ribosomal protection protein [Bacillus sp. Marseille-Q3570]
MEKICIQLEKIEISFLDRVILKVPKLAVHQFDRIGIVGMNGAGKSTLLKLMDGRLVPDKGQVKRFIEFSYFDQVASPIDAEVDYETSGKLSIPKIPIDNFSGGELTRLKLAQIFSTYKEGLLIDEPTTHLDEAGTQFLIEQLNYYYGALVLVSHDRYVLDQLVTKIWEIEGAAVTEYSGNYSDYVEQKERQRKQQQEKHERYEREKVRLLRAADEKMRKAEAITQANSHLSKKEAKAKANKMFMTKSKDTSQKGVQRAAKAIEQRVSQLDAVEAPKEEQKLRFNQPSTLKLHNKFPIMANGLTLMNGGKMLLHEASFQFPLGKTIAIKGPNGSGKTTLLKHIFENREGLDISPKAVIGHYQQMSYQFKKDETVLNFIKVRSDYVESRIRAVLHTMNFKGSDLKKCVKELSGGEAIRLELCRLFLGRYNILILDEPTNFLDVHCIEALECFLKGYEGTVLLVSHDRTFIDRVADCVYEIEDNKLVMK